MRKQCAAQNPLYFFLIRNLIVTENQAIKRRGFTPSPFRKGRIILYLLIEVNPFIPA